MIARYAALFLFFTAMVCAQDEEALYFEPSDTTAALQGFTPLRLFPMPTDITWEGASDNGRGMFALHAWAVPGTGPTTDRANEAVLLGWNPMSRLQPDQPGFWWQFEWSYGQGRTPLFELNLDVHDSLLLGRRPGLRRISYKINRQTGAGVSADFAFQNFSIVEGDVSAGDALPQNYLHISTRSNRMRTALRTEFKKIVQHTVMKNVSADNRMILPLERGNMFATRLIPLYGAIADSTDIVLNSMEPGARYTIKIRNERAYPVHLTWNPTHGRSLFWDLQRPLPERLMDGETLIVEIIMDDDLHAFGRLHGVFRENF